MNWTRTKDRLPEEYALVDVVEQIIGDPRSAGTEPCYRLKRGIWHDNMGRPLKANLEVTHWRPIIRPLMPMEGPEYPTLSRHAPGEWGPFQPGDPAVVKFRDGAWHWVWGQMDHNGRQLYALGNARDAEQAIRDCEAAIAEQTVNL